MHSQHANRSDPRPKPRQPVSREEVEAMAAALRFARDAHQLPPEEFAALHARFRVFDERDTAWTVALTQLGWHRLEVNRWVPRTPPDKFYMRRKAYWAILALVAKEPACPACGSPLRDRSNFCLRCGTPARRITSTQRRCPNVRCGMPAAPGKKFCTSCGTPVV